MPHRATVLSLLFGLAAPLAAQTLEADVRALAAATNRFGADLRAALPANGDAALSPTSIALALLMLEPGVRGTTRDELRRALHLPPELTDARLHQAVHALLDGLLEPTRKQQVDAPRLRILHDTWTQTGFALRADYTAALRTAFDAQPHDVPFVSDPAAARARINAHIAKATENRIPELLPADVIDSATRLVLTNAMWFLGTWQHEFPATGTHDRDFHLAAGSTVSVSTMTLAGSFAYAEDEHAQRLVLPFAQGPFVCELSLPRPGQELATAERTLLLETIVDRPATPVLVQLPRTEIRGAFRLRDALSALGLRTVFGGGDFTGMREANDLAVHDVVHQAWLRVDERGAEAAAATAVVAKRGAKRPTTSAEFRADRPFALAIRDRRTGLVLFATRVLDPRPRGTAAAEQPR